MHYRKSLVIGTHKIKTRLLIEIIQQTENTLREKINNNNIYRHTSTIFLRLQNKSQKGLNLDPCAAELQLCNKIEKQNNNVAKKKILKIEKANKFR